MPGVNGGIAMVPDGCTAYVSGTLDCLMDYYKPPGTPGSRATSSTSSRDNATQRQGRPATALIEVPAA